MMSTVNRRHTHVAYKASLLVNATASILFCAWHCLHFDPAVNAAQAVTQIAFILSAAAVQQVPAGATSSRGIMPGLAPALV